MTLSLTVPPEVESKILHRAAESGQSPDVYASRVLIEAITAPSLGDLLAPARRQVENSDMTDTELDRFLNDLREKVWQEKGSSRS